MKLTTGQRKALQALASGDDLVHEHGAGWWIGDNQTNGKLAKSLIRLLAVKDESHSEKVQRYEINEIGRALLNGVPKPYRAADGTCYATFEELVAAESVKRATDAD